MVKYRPWRCPNCGDYPVRFCLCGSCIRMAAFTVVLCFGREIVMGFVKFVNVKVWGGAW